MKPDSANIDLECARQLLVTLQRLQPVQRQEVRAIDVLVHDVGAIQADSISVVARNQDLACWCRVIGFQPQQLLIAIYREHSLLEQHYPLIIVPKKEYPFWHALMKARPKPDTPMRRALAPIIKKARDTIVERGQVSAQDLPRLGRLRGGFNTVSIATKALETLWYDGELLIAGRLPDYSRIYTLPEYLLPPELIGWSPTPDELLSFCAKKALQVLGLSTLQSWSKLFNIYAGLWKTIPADQRQAYLKSLIAEHWAIPIEVRDNNDERRTTYLIRADDLKYLEKEPPLSTEVQLIPPLDMFLRDRDRLKELFNFVYRFEAYTPRTKRIWGYYTIPILYASRLVGRLDPSRQDSVLILNSLNIEDHTLSEDDIFLNALQRALIDLMTFSGCCEIAIKRSSPEQIASALDLGLLARQW